MAKLDPLAIMLFIVRTAAAIGFILFMTIMFFSLKVDVHEDDMKRTVIELSDVITNSNLTDHKSIFDVQKMNEAESKDPNRNIELYAQNCDYGYHLDVESLAGETACSTGSDCTNFCGSVCGLTSLDMSAAGTLTGNCGCSILHSSCQCKKNGEWLGWYKWSYGYSPTTAIASAASSFPVGLQTKEGILPAKMTITAYDSILTRLSCAAKKATELKEPAKIRKFDVTNVYFFANPTLRRTDTDGTHLCIYYRTIKPLEAGISSSTPDGEIAIDCRYMPDINIEPFRILENFSANAKTGNITAYPVKLKTDCSDIKSNPSLVAGKNDRVETVVFCMEASS